MKKNNSFYLKLGNMGRIKQGVITGLQLRVKWVRVMLIVSVLAIAGVLIYPTTKKIMISSEYTRSADSLSRYATVFDTTVVANVHDSTRLIVRRLEPQPRLQPVPVPEAKANEATIEEKKPFDWKGTITWAIGAINGLVLVVLNIKNLLFKKNS